MCDCERRGTRRERKFCPVNVHLNVKQTLGSVNVKQTLRFFMNTKLTFSPRVNVRHLYHLLCVFFFMGSLRNMSFQICMDVSGGEIHGLP